MLATDVKTQNIEPDPKHFYDGRNVSEYGLCVQKDLNSYNIYFHTCSSISLSQLLVFEQKHWLDRIYHLSDTPISAQWHISQDTITHL